MQWEDIQARRGGLPARIVVKLCMGCGRFYGKGNRFCPVCRSQYGSLVEAEVNFSNWRVVQFDAKAPVQAVH